MLLRDSDGWRLYGPVADHALLPAAEANARALPVEAPSMVLGELVRGLADPLTRAAVRSMLEATGGLAPGVRDPHRSQAEQADLRRALERALERGLLVAVRIVRRNFVPNDAERDTLPPVAPAPPAPVEEKTWIAIQLVDDSDPPRPAPYARYRITLPDGAVRQGALNSMGLARVDGIDPGNCQITFPDLDGGEWQAG